MKVLYLDVYFFINFTVDILAIYFSSRLCKITTSIRRVIIGAFIGGIMAVACVLLEPKGLIYILLLIVSASIIGAVVSGRGSRLRGFRFIIAFLVLETFLGGLITYLFELANKFLLPSLSGIEGGAENRNLLIVSILILLSFGILRLVSLLFKNTASARSLELKLVIGQKEYITCGLVDTGNMLSDPLDGRPVIIVKKSVLFGNEKIKVSAILNNADTDYKKLIRIIPIKGVGQTKVLYGLRCKAYLLNGKKNTEIKATEAVCAIDEDEGSFGGFDALIPAVISDYVD